MTLQRGNARKQILIYVPPIDLEELMVRTTEQIVREHLIVFAEQFHLKLVAQVCGDHTATPSHDQLKDIQRTFRTHFRNRSWSSLIDKCRLMLDSEAIEYCRGTRYMELLAVHDRLVGKGLEKWQRGETRPWD